MSTKPIRVACLQMSSSNHVDENLRFVDVQMQLAFEQDVQLLQLPENFAQMPLNKAERHIEQLNVGLVQSFLSDRSKHYNMMVVAGSLAVLEPGKDKPYARCLVYDHSGLKIASYDKVHLFDVDLPGKESYLESETYLAGDLAKDLGSNQRFGNLNIVDSKLGCLGLSICYDIRFPEQYRLFATQGVDIIMVPSAFTVTTGRAHWRTLLRARAIENQSFVMAAAQVGRHANDRETWGHTMIIDPWGKVLCEYTSDYQPAVISTHSGPTQTGLIIADLELSKLSDLRNKFPSLSHRRL